MQQLDTLIDERRGALPKHRLPFVSLRKRMQDELHAAEPRVERTAISRVVEASATMIEFRRQSALPAAVAHSCR